MSEIDLDALEWAIGFTQTADLHVILNAIPALVDIARAAQAAGPYPQYDYVEPRHADSGSPWYRCRHCRNGHVRMTQIEHADDCRGIALRDALAAIKEAGQ